jgi:7-carboxy-7-deazaguanine synthase
MYTVQEVVSEVKKELKGIGQNRVSITGGDPLHPSHTEGVLELIKALKADGFYINIEAAGSRIINIIFDLVDFISMDYKSPSTGVKTKLSLLKKLNEQFSGKFQIKTVVQDREDFDDVVLSYNELLSMSEIMNFSWCLTPAFMPGQGDSFLERFQDIIKWNMDEGSLFRVIGQQHKWIYGPSIKNV